MSAERTRRCHGDDGAYFALFAFFLTVLLIIAGLVVDITAMQLARRELQSDVDLAILTAGLHLGNPAGREEATACEDVLRVLHLNLTGLPEAASLPCEQLPDFCSSSQTQPTTITGSGTGKYTVELTYPVSDALIADEAFDEGSQDGLVCDRMRLEVSYSLPLVFGGVTGKSTGNLRADATVRGTVGFRTVINPALLLLQRFGCGSLEASGQGRIVVEAFDADHPGVIAADSQGNTTGENACSTNTNASGYVVFGTQTPSGEPAIEARSVGEIPGFLHLYAIRAESQRTAYTVPLGVTPAPTTGPILSRRPADDQYNPASRPAIDDLRAHAQDYVAKTETQLRNLGYAVFPDDFATDCTPNSKITITDPKVFIDCVELNPKGGGGLMFTGTHFVVSGRVRVGSSNSVLFPQAEELLIAGSASKASIDAAGPFSVNDGTTSLAQGPGDCEDRTPADGVDGAVVVVLQGPFESTTQATVHLCQTFLYMADLASPVQRTSHGSCTVVVPCPLDNSGRGYIRIFGDIDWSAADQTSTKADAANPYEDLALWTESSNDSEIKGQGTTLTSGVYFLPNADFHFTGQASESIELNAQFVASTLDMSGQGTLVLKPDPNDVVSIPFADYYLIR